MQQPDQNAPPIHVFLVDDDYDDREIFANVISSLERDVTLCMFGSGQEMLEALDTGEELPDILFLDLQMPGMSGEQCLQALRERPEYDDVCVVIFSSVLNMDQVAGLFDLGANRFLRKPGTLPGLKISLEKTLASCAGDAIGGLSVINCSE